MDERDARIIDATSLLADPSPPPRRAVVEDADPAAEVADASAPDATSAPASAPDAAADPPPARRWTTRRIVTVLLTSLLALVAGTSLWVGVSAQNAINDATQGHGGTPLDALQAQPLVGEGGDRINLLLAGNSFDEKGHEGAALTDSIMVASMNMKTHQITLVSVPRDLWVDYRGTWMKINAVYPMAASGSQGATTLGDADAGMSALADEVEEVTGLHCDQYVLVGYRALQQVVDAVGGIDVVITPTPPPEGKPAGIYDPAASVNIGAGPQHIDGLTALRISRARNDKEVDGNEDSYGVADNDFGRTRNQRMILGSLLTKVKSTPALANPLTLVAIFNSVQSQVRTDVSVAQVRRIYDLASTAGTQPASVSLNGDGTHELLKEYRPGKVDGLVPRTGRGQYDELRAWVTKNLQ